MTKKEKAALEKAFAFPEPERKMEFLRSVENASNRRRSVGSVLRFGSVAAMAVLALGLWGHFKDTAPEREKIPGGEVVQVTTVCTEGGLTITTDPQTSDPADSSAKINTETTAAQSETTRSEVISTVPSVRTRTTSYDRDTVVTRQPASGKTSSEIMITTTAESPFPAGRATALRTTAVIQTAAVQTTVTKPQIVDWTIDPINDYEKKEFVVDSNALYFPMRPAEPVDQEPGGESHESDPRGEIGSSLENAVQKVSKSSEVIVIGEVQQVYYSIDYGVPYTQIDLLVQKTLRGNIGENYLISVVMKGGYISLEEANKYYPEINEEIYDYYGVSELSVKDLKGRTGEQDPQPGDSFLMFLNDNGRDRCFTAPADKYSIIPFDNDTAHLGEETMDYAVLVAIINETTDD